tara:strand:- start:67 stop:621 length:555 start_codon:yes stop_codon:yes gene_type:complete
MLLRTQNTFLLVIDMQEQLAPAVLEYDRIEKNVISLLTAAKQLRVPVRVTEHCADKIGHTVRPLRDHVGEKTVLAKRRFSAYSEPSIATDLDGLNRKAVIIVGIEAHVCVLQTVVDIKEAGYHPYLVVDGTSSRYAEDKEVAIERMAENGAERVTTEMVLFEWLEQADTDDFRKIFPLIRNRSR